MPSFKPASFNEKFLLKVQGKSVASDLQSFPGGTEPPAAVDPELSFMSQQRHKHGKFSSRTRAAAPALSPTEAHLAVTGLWFPLKQVVAPASRNPSFTLSVI